MDKNMESKRFYGKSYPPLHFLFCHNARDFIVEELPLYEFSGSGEHAILKVRKKNLSTPELLGEIAKITGLKTRDIGYCGLKDKNSLSYQYISLPLKAFRASESRLNESENFKILESSLHNNKLKIGHLRGNKFFIRLKKVDNLNFTRLKDELLKAKNNGFPNFFGYQRFGNFGDNYLQALNVKRAINRQNAHEKFLLSSLQSFLFNKWLETRLKITNIIYSFSLKDAANALMQAYGIYFSKDSIRVLKDSNLSLIPLNGDVLLHYPFGKLFYFKLENLEYDKLQDYETGNLDSIESKTDSNSDLERLKKGQVAITGLLSGLNCGKDLKYFKEIIDFADSKDSIESKLTESKKNKKVWLAHDIAGQIEQHFAFNIQAFGSRRYAWVYPSDVEISYDKVHNHALLSFILPSGAYATSLLEYLKNGNLFE